MTGKRGRKKKKERKKQWRTLEHNGILFPPEYKPQGIRVRIKGRPVTLDAGQEEMIYQWAKKKDTPYVQDATFQRNFTADLAGALGGGFEGLEYADIDFADAYRIVDREKEARERMTKEERKELAKKRKEVREGLKLKYGRAVMDGKDVDVGNYMAEPPGIFIGRGDHPLRGRWKPRVTQADVTLNMGRGAPVPPGDWKEVVHDQASTWLASWTDYLTQKRKYVWLADTAGVKQERDRAKYDKAVKLAGEVGKIEKSMVRDMSGKNRKIATACYLIYKTAMRVGDEKDPDEADTVGATTLRKEHVSVTADTIELDFLGKDSVRWRESIRVGDGERQFQKNLEELMERKKPKDEIFDGISSRHVNSYYSGIVAGMSAKVFRTYLATKVVREYLAEHDDLGDSTPHAKLHHAKLANLEAAKRCNHKRTIPKTFEQSLQKKRDKLRDTEPLMPWTRSEESLRKARDSKPKTDKQRQSRKKRIKKIEETIERQKARHADRLERMRLGIELAERTRDYNLGTSLRNYIDPRVFKAWTGEVGVEWQKMYTAALQKKFLWLADEKASWKDYKK